jgi:hypothetical protein
MRRCWESSQSYSIFLLESSSNGSETPKHPLPLARACTRSSNQPHQAPVLVATTRLSQLLHGPIRCRVHSHQVVCLQQEHRGRMLVREARHQALRLQLLGRPLRPQSYHRQARVPISHHQHPEAARMAVCLLRLLREDLVLRLRGRDKTAE